MRKILIPIVLTAIIIGCANMDTRFIDGGWYDENPPKVVRAVPDDKATNVKGRKISIVFDEYIKVDNPT